MVVELPSNGRALKVDLPFKNTNYKAIISQILFIWIIILEPRPPPPHTLQVLFGIEFEFHRNLHNIKYFNVKTNEFTILINTVKE